MGQVFSYRERAHFSIEVLECPLKVNGLWIINAKRHSRRAQMGCEGIPPLRAIAGLAKGQRVLVEDV